jgi:hypothetical protein
MHLASQQEQEAKLGGLQVQAGLGKKSDPFSKIITRALYGTQGRKERKRE